MDRQISSNGRLFAYILMILALMLPVKLEKPAPEAPANIFLSRLLRLAVALVIVCTVFIAFWMGWNRPDQAHVPIVMYSALVPDARNVDFFTTMLWAFTGDSYEVRYLAQNHHLKLGDLVRLWGKPAALRCAETTMITWDDRGIRALLALPDSPVIELDAAISIVSVSPSHTPYWFTRAGRCRSAQVSVN